MKENARNSMDDVMNNEITDKNNEANDHISFDCDDCSIRFKDVQLLQRHRLEHTVNQRTKGTIRNELCTMSAQCLLCPLQLHVKASNAEIDKLRVNLSRRNRAICLKSILSEPELASHLLDRHTASDYTMIQCCGCGGSFNSAIDLQSYVDLNMSTGIEVLKVGSVYFFGCGCRECKLVRRKKKMKGSRQPPNRYRCLVCDISYNCGTKLQFHMRSHTEEERNNCLAYYSHEESFSERKPFSCRVCGKVFGQRARYLKHMEFHCRPNNSQRSDKMGLHAYICDLCDAKFDDSRSFREHKTSHTKLGQKPYRCNLCPKRYTHRERLDKHMLRHNGEKLHGCYFCSKRFNYMSHVKRHLEVHLQDGEKPHICEQCSKRFATKKCLENHMYTHTGTKPYVCKYCDKAYIQSSHLQRHMKSHTKDGGRSLQCGICPKKFASKQVLERHQYTHTGERPYCCTYCSKTYTQPTHLKRHLDTHFQFGGKSYQCNRCESNFDSKVLLNIHKVTHSEKTYACKCCDATFARASELRLHMRGHIKNGEKPFKCEHCPKQLMTEKLLARHVEIHHQAKIYTCSVCFKEFSQNAYLKRHQKLSVKCSRSLKLRNKKIIAEKSTGDEEEKMMENSQLPSSLDEITVENEIINDTL